MTTVLVAQRDLRVGGVPAGSGAHGGGGPGRVALLIGNGAYRTAPLGNPVNDAIALGGALRKLGFRVLVESDLTLPRTEAAMTKFLGMVTPGDVALFYYAGHGVQIA